MKGLLTGLLYYKEFSKIAYANQCVFMVSEKKNEIANWYGCLNVKYVMKEM